MGGASWMGSGGDGWLAHWGSSVFVNGELAEGFVQFATFADVGAVLCELEDSVVDRVASLLVEDFQLRGALLANRELVGGLPVGVHGGIR